MKKFWSWSDRNETLTLSFATILFALQLVHLYWLSTAVIAMRITGTSYFNATGIFEFFILLVDYTEIPALLATSLVYLYEYKKTKSAKALLFLFFLNSQWLHIFWITDEFIVSSMRGEIFFGIPVWASWIAIFIDYLELPVIFDTLKKLAGEIRNGNFKKALLALREAD